MAQKMIDLKKKQLCRSVESQTECHVTPDFRIQLSKNKYIKLYKSKCYSDYILTLNVNESKKIVITKSMWKILRKNIKQIDGAFMVN